MELLTTAYEVERERQEAMTAAERKADAQKHLTGMLTRFSLEWVQWTTGTRWAKTKEILDFCASEGLEAPRQALMWSALFTPPEAREVLGLSPTAYEEERARQAERKA